MAPIKDGQTMIGSLFLVEGAKPWLLMPHNGCRS
jgi:hypothetical protein